MLSTDEDLLLVFGTEAGWVLVCETSVRLVTGREEISRIELADTVRRAWWTGAGLQAEDARGTTTALTIAGDRLVVVTPGQVRDRLSPVTTPEDGTGPAIRLNLIRRDARSIQVPVDAARETRS